MSEFKRWISYIYAWCGEVKEKNTGFVKVDVRNGRCRFHIGIKGAYGCDEKGMDVGIYTRREGRPVRISVGKMRICGGSGELDAVTGEDNLFESGLSLAQTGGLWITGKSRNTIYLTSWEKGCLDIRDFLPAAEQADRESEGRERRCPCISAAAVQEAAPAAEETVRAAEQPVQEKQEVQEKQPEICLEKLPQPDLWESLCRYYPKASPELRGRGVELLQIRPADIRYLPQRLWHFGSNSFLLHGYYRYRHLILGRMAGGGEQDYILGVRGARGDRESFSAGLFGFHEFLPLTENGQEGYWYTHITL